MIPNILETRRLGNKDEHYGHYVISGTNRGNIVVNDLVNSQNTWSISMNGEITDICASSDCFFVGSLSSQLMITMNGKGQKYAKLKWLENR
jgi:hypothetical protein